MFAKNFLITFAATCAVLVASEDAKITRYPYVVSVEYYQMHTCGGVILSPTVVLTTAHCASGLNIEKVGIRAGSAIREDYNGEYVQLKRVKEAFIHPQYQDEGDDNNVAVYVLEEPFEMNEHVNLIKMTEEEELKTKTVVVGWGRNSRFEEAPELRAVSILRSASAACETSYQGSKTLSPNMFCGVPTEVICENQGSPAVYQLSQRDELIGIVSYSEVKRVYPNHLKGNGPLEQKRCATENPLILMRISTFRKWIASFL